MVGKVRGPYSSALCGDGHGGCGTLPSTHRMKDFALHFCLHPDTALCCAHGPFIVRPAVNMEVISCFC